MKIKELPLEIQKIVFLRQEEQGNVRNNDFYLSVDRKKVILHGHRQLKDTIFGGIFASTKIILNFIKNIQK